MSLTRRLHQAETIALRAFGKAWLGLDSTVEAGSVHLDSFGDLASSDALIRQGGRG